MHEDFCDYSDDIVVPDCTKEMLDTEGFWGSLCAVFPCVFCFVIATPFDWFSLSLSLSLSLSAARWGGCRRPSRPPRRQAHPFDRRAGQVPGCLHRRTVQARPLQVLVSHLSLSPHVLVSAAFILAADLYSLSLSLSLLSDCHFEKRTSWMMTLWLYVCFVFGGNVASCSGLASLEPGPSRARYFPRDMLLLTTTARERAWYLLKITSPLIGWLGGDSPIPGVSPRLAQLPGRTLYIVEILRTESRGFFAFEVRMVGRCMPTVSSSIAKVWSVKDKHALQGPHSHDRAPYITIRALSLISKTTQKVGSNLRGGQAWNEWPLLPVFNHPSTSKQPSNIWSALKLAISVMGRSKLMILVFKVDQVEFWMNCIF